LTEYQKCPECCGHGQVSDYGPFGLDFYGPKECSLCFGTGSIRKLHRDSKGRFARKETE
jgi:DnaJ-class molecular chaperone